MDELEQFVRQIIKEKGYTGLDSEVEDMMAQELKQQLIEQINRSIIEELPDEKIDELERKLDSGEMAPEQIQQFAADNGVDINATVTKALIFFRGFYLGAEA